jgi:hypothetical protein
MTPARRHGTSRRGSRAIVETRTASRIGRLCPFRASGQNRPVGTKKSYRVRPGDAQLGPEVSVRHLLADVGDAGAGIAAGVRQP